MGIDRRPTVGSLDCGPRLTPWLLKVSMLQGCVVHRTRMYISRRYILLANDLPFRVTSYVSMPYVLDSFGSLTVAYALCYLQRGDFGAEFGNGRIDSLEFVRYWQIE